MQNSDFHNSWYAASAGARQARQTLGGDVQADVCIIGGGATGLSAAMFLAQKGRKVVVLESKTIGWGASGRNGGQFITGYSCSMDTIERLVGKENGQFFMDASVECISLLKSVISENGIDCDLKLGQICAAIKPAHDTYIQETLESYAHYGYNACSYIGKASISDHIDTERYISLLHDSQSGHLHPLKLTLGLAEAAERHGAVIYENTPALSYKNSGGKVTIQTEQGAVTSDFLILAGNAYLKGLNPKIERRVMPVGTYIAATKPLGKERALSLLKKNEGVCDLKFVLDYYRLSSDWRMLYGGRVSYSRIDPPSIAESIRRRMVWTFPQLINDKIEYSWGGYVGITMNRAPHFGRQDGNVLFAQGFSGHGVSLTIFAGKIMSDAILGQQETFDLFSKIPHAPFPGGRMFRTPLLVLAMTYYKLRDYF